MAKYSKKTGDNVEENLKSGNSDKEGSSPTTRRSAQKRSNSTSKK